MNSSDIYFFAIIDNLRVWMYLLMIIITELIFALEFHCSKRNKENAIKEFKRSKGHIALIILVILFVLIPLLFQVKTIIYNCFCLCSTRNYYLII